MAIVLKGIKGAIGDVVITDPERFYRAQRMLLDWIIAEHEKGNIKLETDTEKEKKENDKDELA